MLSPLPHEGTVFGENSFYRDPEGKCTGDLCRVPPAAARHGRARQSSEMGPCGDCRRVLWVPDPWGQYSGKIRFIEEPEVKTRGVDLWLNVVLTRGWPTPKSKFKYGLYRCELWVLLPPLPHEESVFGENSFYRAPRPVPGAPSSGTPRQSQAKFRDGTVWGV